MRYSIDDIGTPFSHPVKTKLGLADVFIYPDLKVTTVTPKVGSEAVVLSADVIEYIFGKTRLSIAGPPTSGKTSFAKSLYGDLLQRKKLVPVMLQHDDIRGTGVSQVRSAIERAFGRQYSKRLLDRYNQLDPESKAVIVDDWHKTKLNAKGKALVLEALGRMFGRVIVFTDDASVFHQMADAMATGELPGFHYCEIRQFGYRLRGELVSKWETLGREFELEELELTHRISEREHLLDALIGKGIVPAFPFFIFSALQADQQLTSHNANYGSYGHIYQALLTTRMARANPKKLGLKFAYLSMVAFEMFETRSDSITRAQLKFLHQKYEKEYIVSVDQTELLDELEAAQALSTAGDLVRFRYRYAYYYFVAEYFHDGISNVKDAEALRQKLRGMANSAYNDENAHILIFYLYMSKDRQLIEHILGNAQRLFASEGMSDLDTDVAFVNALYGTVPKLEAPSADTERSREEYRARRDDAADAGSGTDAHATAETAETRQLDFSFQSMSIMGQVLKNFPADLRADLKLSLTQESYRLGLRTLRAFLKALGENIDAFRRDMVSYFKLLQPFSHKPDEEVQAAADKAVRGFTEMILFGMMKKISVSVGTEELRDTYEMVRAMAGEEHLPTRMIDFAIKLDHFARIPEADVEDLRKRLQGNPAVYTTLRMLVGEFLYLFPVDHRVRQRMIELLDFQPGPATMSGPKKVKRISTTAG